VKSGCEVGGGMAELGFAAGGAPLPHSAFPEPLVISTRVLCAFAIFQFLREDGSMKTTFEIPDALFRRAKAAAAEEGKSLKEFFAEAVSDRLNQKYRGDGGAMPWEAAFGGLRQLHRENRRIDRIIAAEFETVDQEERR
jgi:hypothetical protein